MNMTIFENLNPSYNDLISVLILFFLFFTFFANSRVLTNEKTIFMNVCIGWSPFSFIYLLFHIIFKLDLKVISLLYTLISLVISFFYLKKINYNSKLSLKSFIFIIPLFFILLSTKTFGFDSFAYILKRTLYLMEYDIFPLEVFRSNYPLTSQLLHYFSNIHSNEFSENIPAIIDLIFLILMSLIIFHIFRLHKMNSKSFLVLSFIIVFFNPMIMNVYSYSSYEDLHLSFILMVVYFFLFRKNFSLKNFSNKDYLIFGSLLSLLSITKIIGIIISLSIIFSLIIISLIEKNKILKFFNYLIILIALCCVQSFIWHFHIWQNEIFVGNEFKGFRLEVLKNIPINYWYQFEVKKLLSLSNMLALLSPLMLIFTKKKKIKRNIIIIFIPVFVWNLFLNVFMVFIQAETNALEYHNFFRYLSIFSGTFTLIIIVIFVNIFRNKFFLNSKKYFYLLTILFIILTLINVKKIRRDLDFHEINLRKNLYENLYNNLDYEKKINETKDPYNKYFYRFYLNTVKNKKF